MQTVADLQRFYVLKYTTTRNKYKFAQIVQETASIQNQLLTSTAVCKKVVMTMSIDSRLTRVTSLLAVSLTKHGIKWGQGSEVSRESNDNHDNHFANRCTNYPMQC